MIKRFLQHFADDGGDDKGGKDAGSDGGGNSGYSYEQLEEIASARAERASRAALADFFRKQGMSEEDITTAINDFKEKKKASQPDVSEIEKERDAAKKELEAYKNNEILRKKGVKEEDLDYVTFKVEKMVTDKLPFEKAAEQFLKDNTRFTGNSYRVVSGAESGGGGKAIGTNDSINDAIRRAARR